MQSINTPPKPKRKSKFHLFLELSNYDSISGLSRLVNVSEFTGPYESLKLGNGGSWCRDEGLRKKDFKLITIKNNGLLTCKGFDGNELEIAEIKSLINYSQFHFPVEKGAPGTSIKYIQVVGKKNKSSCDRDIRQDIRTYFGNKACVNCSLSKTPSKCHLFVVDHKNSLYNDPRVLNTQTQRLDDFQSLCNKCNLIKRSVTEKERKSRKRCAGTLVESVAHFGIDFIAGDELLDFADPNALVGTYWYDCAQFRKDALRLYVGKHRALLNEMTPPVAP